MSCTPRFCLLKITISLFLSALFCSLFSYTISPKEVEDALVINELVVNCRFEKAEHLSDSLLNENRDKPLYYYLVLASIGLRTLDSDVFKNEMKFKTTFDSGMNLVSKIEQKGKTSDLMMIKGFLKASYFSYMLVGGKISKAIGDGRGALDIIEEAKKLNQTNYDSDYFIGFYSFAKGELRNRLKVLLFWLPDGVKDGQKSLEICSKKSRFMRSAASMVLVDVFVRDGEFSKARPMLDSMKVVYPNSRFLYWTEARYWEGKNDDRRAAEAYRDLSRRYFDDFYWHNGIETATMAVKFMKKAKMDKELKAFSEEVKTSVPSSRLAKKDRGKFDKLISYAKG